MPPAKAISIQQALDDLEEEFSLPLESLNDLVNYFIKLMDHGLAKDGADMAMIPAFVTGVPDGSEVGTYLALDLGGTNLRVCEVQLQGKGKLQMKQEKYTVSDQLKTGPVADLMDYIASSVDTFLKDYGSSDRDGRDHHMGFTFSFPVEQTALAKGTLIKWTKGFNCPDAPGKDVVELLQAALDRKQIKVKVNALVNDTVGALLANGYQAGGSFIGAIYGTGTNGAYVANVDDITKLKLSSAGTRPETMLVNTEWGGFSDNAQEFPEGLPITPYDNYVDRISLRPRHHAFEKMISGMYLGEVVRAVLLSLVDKLLIFKGRSSRPLNTAYGFDTALVSAIEADTTPLTSAPSSLSGSSSTPTACPTLHVLTSDLGLDRSYISDVDLHVVRFVCKIVSTRAARLSAVPIAATIKHVKLDEHHSNPHSMTHSPSTLSVHSGGSTINIGVDGSVIEFLPGFQDRLHLALKEMLGEEVFKKLRFAIAKDGSGVGAALASLMAVKQEQAGNLV